MNDGDDWRKLKDELKTYTRWAASALIDSAFLVIWVFVQWGTENIIQRLDLSGVDKWVLSVFKVLFAISTLAPIILYLYVDIRVMLIQTRRRIRQEIEADKNHENQTRS